MRYYKIFFLGLIIFLYGCNNFQNIINVEYKYEKMVFENHQLKVELYLENISNSRKISKIIDNLIYNGKDFEGYKQYIEDDFINNFISNYYPKIIKEDGTEYIYHTEFIKNHKIIFHNNKYIIFMNKLYFFASGAAHGNYLIEYDIIDLSEEKILEIDDLINKISDDLLKEYINDQYEINNFLRKNIWPPDTINFNNRIVELIWNTYSITPYVSGIIKINLNQEIIESYLTEKGKELMKIINEM